MRAIQENDMAEPGPQWASEGTAGLAEGAGESQKSPGQNLPTPVSRSGGVRCSAPAAEDLERRGDLSPRRGIGDRPEVTRAPLAPAAATSPPTQHAPPPACSSFRPLLTSSTRGEISRPTPHRPASRCTPSQVHPNSVPARVLSPGPHAALTGHPRPTPAAKLTRPGVFLRSFSCSPRRLSRGGQLCSLHLPFRSSSPPTPLLHISGDRLIWLGGAARDEGGAAEARRGSRATGARGEVWEKGCTGKLRGE